MKIFLSVAAVAATVLVTPAVTLAQRPSFVPGSRGVDMDNSRRPATPGAAGKTQSCQAREAAVKARSEALVDLAKAMEARFGDIASKVESYYTSKLVPQKKTLANYQTLVGDIALKKTAIDAALVKTSADAASFSCTGTTNPKMQVATYREDMQKVILALQDYRTSVRNLIVAIRSLNGTLNRTSGGNNAPGSGRGQE